MRIDKAQIARYSAYLRDQYRPPSRGGNTRAWHAHYITISEETYSFLALGAKKWVYLSDTVSFDWEWDSPAQQYRNIDPNSIEVWDKDGVKTVRGERGTKRWRTAPPRPHLRD